MCTTERPTHRPTEVTIVSFVWAKYDIKHPFSLFVGRNTTFDLHPFSTRSLARAPRSLHISRWLIFHVQLVYFSAHFDGIFVVAWWPQHHGRKLSNKFPCVLMKWYVSHTAFHFRENSFTAFHLFGVAVPFRLEMLDLLEHLKKPERWRYVHLTWSFSKILHW